jgi:hypothetical protein
MPYCRWGSLGGRCDIYCYETANGYVVSIAAKRASRSVAPINYRLSGDALHKDVQRYNAAMDARVMRPIGGPHDGATFVEGSLQELKERLLALRDAGYLFPDSALNEINDEIAEEHDAAALTRAAS